MENLSILTKDTITSLELLEQINFFREQEGRAKTNHKDLLIIIETEFTDINRKRVEGGMCPETTYLINEQLESENITVGEYVHPQNKKNYKMYILPIEKAKQCLLKESRFVRRAVINYIEDLEKELEYRKKTFLTLNKNLDFYVTDEEIEEHIKTEEKSGVVFVKRKKIPNSYNLEFLTVTEFLFRKGEDLNNFSISDIGEKALESCKKIGLFVGKAWEGNRLVNTYPIHTLNHVYYSILDRRQIFRQMNLIGE